MDYTLVAKEISAYILAFIKSETKEGIYYRVELDDEVWTCSCPHFRGKQEICKHIQWVKLKQNL